MAARPKKKPTRARVPSKAEASRLARNARARERRAEAKQAHARELARRRREYAKRRERERLAFEERSRRAKKGHRTRLARERARAALRTMLEAAAEGAPDAVWAPLKASFQGAKRDLFDAVDDDFDRYAAILDELADDEGTDWSIAYGPGDE